MVKMKGENYAFDKGRRRDEHTEIHTPSVVYVAKISEQ